MFGHYKYAIFAPSSGLRPVPYGQTKSAETLFSLPTPSTIANIDYEMSGDIQHDEYRSTLQPPSTVLQRDSKLQDSHDYDIAQTQTEHEFHKELYIELNERLVSRDETEDEASGEEKEDKDDLTFDPKPKPKSKPKPKPPPKVPAAAPVAAPAGAVPTGNPDVPDGKDQGIMQMDCLVSPEACQNACYYQNCVRGAAGNIKHVTYQVGYNGKQVAKIGEHNRLQSGVTVSTGRPCRTGPFGQKFWDPYPFNEDRI